MIFLRVINVSILSFILVFCNSCTSFKAIDADTHRQELIQSLKIGERILVQTKDQKEFYMVVQSVTQNEIIGEERRVQHEEILLIKRSKVSLLKTAGLIYIGFGIVAGLILHSMN